VIAALAGAAGVGMPADAQSIYNNGPLATGATLSNSAPAPPGYQWSEMQVGNTMLACTAQRFADDVTLTVSTQVEAIDVFAYVSGAGTGTSPFTSGTLRVWNGSPANAPSSVVVFGNPTTNRLTGSALAHILRARWGEPETIREVWAIRLSVGTVLPPGTYWFDWSLNTGVAPPVTLPGQLQKPGANALFFQTSIGFWRSVSDAGSGFDQDLPFVLYGTAQGPACFANCDASTAVPVLNVQDFSCFLGKFASGNPYANCDGSTATPVLNVQDFSCFLQKFAAGCSAP
jgi:hypothetical protein